MHTRPAPSRVLLLPLLAAGATLLPLGAASASPAPAAVAALTPAGEACADGTGVTVVVDLTDLGGAVEVGCAEGAPASGAQALVDAGFTDTRDAAQMICAIDGLPDPCPTTFEGSWWSYWSAGPDGAWVSYDVGPDQSAPEPGTVEGWRYHDGSAGPTVTPAAALATVGEAAAEDAAQEDASADQTARDAAGADDAVVSDEQDGPGPVTPLVLGAALAVLLVAAVVGLTRRRRDPHGPGGQD